MNHKSPRINPGGHSYLLLEREALSLDTLEWLPKAELSSPQPFGEGIVSAFP